MYAAVEYIGTKEFQADKDTEKVIYQDESWYYPTNFVLDIVTFTGIGIFSVNTYDKEKNILFVTALKKRNPPGITPKRVPTLPMMFL